MTRRTILLALLPAMLVAACSQDSRPVYPVTLDRARQILTTTDLPPVFGHHALDVEIRTYKPTEVTWIVRKNGSEMMRYVATLSEAGQGRTRVGLELEGAKSGPTGDVEQRFAENPSTRNLYLVAMGERIAAAIEGRSLDVTKIYPALGAAALANMGNLRKSLDEAVKASEELERSHSQSIKRKRG